MAIGFDVYTLGVTGSGTSLTYAHTTSGSDRGLVIGVIGAQAGTGDVVTGVTYAGVAMTKLQTIAPGANNGSDRYRYLFYLANPALGTNNVVISASATTFLQGDTGSYTGTKQTGQPDSTNKATQVSGSSSFSVSTTVVAPNCWLVAFVSEATGVNISAGAGTTNRNPPAVVAFSDSNGTVGTGSQSLAWTSVASGSWGGMILSMAPAVASGPANLKTYNTNPKANIKTMNTNPIANVKTFDTNP